MQSSFLEEKKRNMSSMKAKTWHLQMFTKANRMLLTIAVGFLMIGSVCAQLSASPYSLQAAVDALNIKDHYNSPVRYGGVGSTGAGPQEQDYWDEEANSPSNIYNRHRMNRILAKYLAHENTENSGLGNEITAGYGFNENTNKMYPILDEKKRSSFFRERESKYDTPTSSVFREREAQPYDHSELTDQFLKEIEESRELDREERYKEALRRLWEKYQQQENEIEGELYEGQKSSAVLPNNYYGQLMQKRRSYPMLPWLPMPARKKRFPVSKRSPKITPGEDSIHFAETNEKVANDLSELFGKPIDEKKKRSTDDQSSTKSPDYMPSTISDMRNENIENHTSNSTKVSEQSHTHHEHSQHQHNHRKRNDHVHDNKNDNVHDDEDESEERDGPDEHDEEEDGDDHEDFDDEEEEERKRKRDVNSAAATATKRINKEVVKEDQIVPGDLSDFRRKKSIEWSKYFGIDRRKKSAFIAEANESNLDVKKRSTNVDESNPNVEDDEKQKKKMVDPEKLENMDRKLQSIEDLIIDETIKYTGAHEGTMNSDEIRRLKDRVVSRLATAYSLEKMRRALQKLRQSVDNENHLLHNVIEGSNSQSDYEDSIQNQKRLSVKKEKVDFEKHHPVTDAPNSKEKLKEIQSNSMMSATAGTGNSVDDSNENHEANKKKKRTGYMRYPDIPNDLSEFEEELGAGHYEPLNDAYLGNKNYMVGSNQCPLIEAMAERCRGVDLLSGDLHQDLLPICGIHQICYLCGVSQVACDFQYLAEADTICGRNNECQSAARSALMILRGSPGPQLGPKECFKNPCLHSAMREIGL